MRSTIAAVAAILLAASGGAAWAQSAPQPAAAAQRATGGSDRAHRHHGGFPVHGRRVRAERGDTKPGSTVRSAERNGAEPVGITPPVPAPTVGATGGSVPYAR
jgi:hypothetical protein